MNRDSIIKKAMIKLGFGKNLLEEKDLKRHYDKLHAYIKDLKEEDTEVPKKLIKYFQDNFITAADFKKEEMQELLAYLKTKSLIKESIQKNVYMEKAWRVILKNWDLQGFILRN